MVRPALVRPVRLAVTLAGLGLSLLLAGCERQELPIAPACPPVASAEGVPGSVWADPEVLSLDAAAPHFDAAGCGSILLLDGWGRVEPLDESGVPFVWAQGRTASLEVPRPPMPLLEDFVLTVQLSVFLEPGPAQGLEIHAGGRRLGRRELEYGWNRVEFPVPAEALEERWNRFELRFDWAVSPESLGSSEDTRELAGAVSHVQLRPARRERRPLARLERRPGGLDLRLPPGAVVTWPLPRNAAVELTWPVEVVGGQPCSWSARLVGPDDAAGIGTAGGDARIGGDPSQGRLTLDVRTGDAWSRLALSWCPDEGADEGAEAGDLLVRLPRELPTWTLETKENENAATGRAPDLFLYLVDTLRADALSIYSGERPTPHLAELAADGVVYDEAWTASTWTLPATVSILTGVSPSRHGILTGRHGLGESAVVPLAERLNDLGFLTLGLSQSLVAGPSYGIDRGFDHFRLDNHLGSQALRSHRLRRLFLRYLFAEPAAAQAPLFVYLHSVDPHDPYRPRDGFEDWSGEDVTSMPRLRYDPHDLNRASREGADPPAETVGTMRSLYQGEVAWADQQLGRFLALLRHLGLYEGSVFAFTSDHGEEFGEHGGFGHGRTVYEEQLRVPLVVRYPDGRHGGRRVARPVSTLDLAPTFLEWARPETSAAEDVPSLSGRSLHGTADDHWIVGVTSPLPSAPLREVDFLAFRRGDLKCIRSNLPHDQFGREAPRWQVYDLAADPGEQRPLPADDPRVTECREAWERLRREGDLRGGAEGLVEADEKTLEELRALGYIGDDVE